MAVSNSRAAAAYSLLRLSVRPRDAWASARSGVSSSAFFEAALAASRIWGVLSLYMYWKEAVSARPAYARAYSGSISLARRNISRPLR